MAKALPELVSGVSAFPLRVHSRIVIATQQDVVLLSGGKSLQLVLGVLLELVLGGELVVEVLGIRGVVTVGNTALLGGPICVRPGNDGESASEWQVIKDVLLVGHTSLTGVVTIIVRSSFHLLVAQSSSKIVSADTEGTTVVALAMTAGGV
jgi:hypothetical protein